MLVHAAYQSRVTTSWFDPEYWGKNARPVSSGGRGGAWFLQAGEDRLVLREYLRGGLMAKVSRRAYLYTKEAEVRSFAEFQLLNKMVSLGLPVPNPVAAWYRKRSPLRYQAAIIVERLERTTPLAGLLQVMNNQSWEILGKTIREFHDVGVMHADLNCFNILVRDNDFFLIDFDKSTINPVNSAQAWKAQNLSRLHRSLKKVSGGESLSLRQGWQSFMVGYDHSS